MASPPSLTGSTCIDTVAYSDQEDRANTTDDVTTNIELVPVCVGVGDAIFVCIHYNYSDGTITKHCYLVDGSLGGGGPDRIEELSGLSPRGKEYKGITNLAVTPINNTDYLKLETTYRRLTTEGFELKGIIVTHPDQDHYQGIRYLLQTHEINCPVLMTNRFLQERLMRNVDLSEFLQVLELTHIGKHVKENQEGDEHELVRLGFPKFFEFRHSEIGLVIYTLRDQRYFPKRITERALNKDKSLEPADDNETSIVTTIRNPDNNEEVLAYLTGDAVLKIKFLVENGNYFRGKHPCVFQVPHHGSNDNSEAYLYEQIGDKCVYLISCGINSPFPHQEVLHSICTANQGQDRIRIILTSNRNLNKTKMENIEANRQVSIYYWDEHVHAHQSQPYLRIPLSASIDITSIHNPLVEWSIEGYMAMINEIPNKKSHACSFYLKYNTKFWIIDETKIGEIHVPILSALKKASQMHGIYGFPSPWSPSKWDSKDIIILTNIHYDVLNNVANGPIILEKIENDLWKICRCHQTTWQVQHVRFTRDSSQWTEGVAARFELKYWKQG